MSKQLLIVLLFLSFGPLSVANAGGADEGPRVLLIVLDGLRPDYVTREMMPNLFQMAEQGVFCERHHSAFPTVTRVNSAVLATGAYPEQNGLLGNSVYFPNIDPTSSISNWDAGNLIRIERAERGRLLTATSLCEMLAAHDQQVLACGSGSSGSVFLQNHKLNGAVINVNASYPEAIREEITRVLGPVPTAGTPNTAQAKWAVDAYLKIGLDRVRPALGVLWLNEPDHTAHGFGIGAPKTLAALREIDGEIGRVLAGHAKRGLALNIIVVSDHGFITHVGGSERLASLLEQAGLKTTASDVVEVGGAIYINEDKVAKLPQVVELLRAQPWVGAIYTRPSDENPDIGIIPGTLSTSVIRWNHRRAADVYVEVVWDDNENQYGIRGTNRLSGSAAGHGSSSPYELRACLIAAGPAFKRGTRNRLPTGNVDIAPTIAHLLGYEPAETMQGRILAELLEGSAASTATPEEKEITVSSATTTLKASLDVLGEHTYLNYVKAERK